MACAIHAIPLCIDHRMEEYSVARCSSYRFRVEFILGSDIHKESDIRSRNSLCHDMACIYDTIIAT